MSEDIDLQVATDQENKLSERVTHAAIRKKGKQKLDVQTVIIEDADTGELLGAQDFFLSPPHHASVLFDQIAVQNTWYTVLETTTRARIYAIGIRMNTLAEDLEFRLTIDGVVLTVGTQAAAVAGTNYYLYLTCSSVAGYYPVASTSAYMLAQYQAVDCRTFKYEVRKTSAGAANHLLAAVGYAVQP